MTRRWASLAAAIVVAACEPAEELSHGDPGTLPAPFEVLFTGSMESSAGASQILVARNERDGRRAARQVGTPDAAAILQNWTNYEDRALIRILVGNGFERGSQLRVLEVRTLALLPQIEVTARVEPSSEQASLEPSALWAIVSVSAGRVPPDSDGRVAPELECSLHVEGRSTRTQCLPVPDADNVQASG